jgi:prepilin-type N-terminal cleavage/methylation domain-containing protein/prepilin-type processing-associated H-X9-DG protein
MKNEVRSKGFTLIELLVVIAIIAILAAILFPVFAQAREKARQTTCLSNEKQIALAFVQYVQDYDETMPAYEYGSNAIGTNYAWEYMVYPYLKSVAVYKCPSIKSTEGGVNDNLSPQPWPDIDSDYNCNTNGFNEGGAGGSGPDFPADTNTQSFPSQANPWDPDSGNGNGACGGEGGPGVNLSSFLSPSTTIEIYEFTNSYPNPLDGGSEWWGTGNETNAPHTDRANYAFVDGHAKSYLPMQTFATPGTTGGTNMWTRDPTLPVTYGIWYDATQTIGS